MGYLLETCADSVQSAIEAEKGGADRIELCANLVIGGTSPGESLFRQVREHTGLKIRTLLRPRFGDFCYDQYEFRTLCDEVRLFQRLGADGVVIGILRPDGTLNMEQMRALREEAGDMGVTLHRAFDVCRDADEAMEQCIELGIDTILTSGQKSSAWEGRDQIAELVKKSAGRIEILAGAGISAETIEKLIPYTKACAYHMSGKIVTDSRMKFRREGVPMGIPGFGEFEIWQTSADKVREASEVLKRAQRGELSESWK